MKRECRSCGELARQGFDFCCSYCAKDWEEANPNRRVKLEVCDRCEGHGEHTNPSIDGNGLTSMDIERLGGQEFLEEYMNGVYNVPCERCNGARVISDEQSIKLRIIEGAESLRELKAEAPYLFV
jgi:DnaJ-class molecular chaperone